MRTINNARKSAMRLLLLLFIMMFILVVCGETISLPISCGPGGLNSIYASPMLDYVHPSNGMIVRRSDFTELEVQFLRPVDIISNMADLNNTMEIYWLENYWEANEDVPLTEGKYANIGVVLSNPIWQPLTDDECDNYDIPRVECGNYSHNLKFDVDPNAINIGSSEEGWFQRFRFLRTCVDAEPNEPCTDTPFTYYDDIEFEPNTEVFIGVVPDWARRDPPYITFSTLDDWRKKYEHYTQQSPPISDHVYVPPHHHLHIKFSREMGFIAFEGSPLWGFLFGLGSSVRTSDGLKTDRHSILESDSGVGLEPGRDDYFLSVRSTDAVPAGMRLNIAHTIDRFGNPLASMISEDPLTLQPETTYAPEPIYTSHVQLTVPFHEPYTGVPDSWYDQLADMGYADDPFISTVITKDVWKLSTQGPPGFEPVSDVLFENEPFVITQQGYPGNRGGNIGVTIGIGEIKGISDPRMIVVHAYDENDKWLGADILRVYSYPRPTNRIKIVSFNAFNVQTVDHDMPPICETSPLPDKCIDCFIGDVPEWCQEECADRWPFYCWIFNSTAPNNGFDWEERLRQFAIEIVADFQPAIIAVQETYQDSDCGIGGNCHEISPGDWLNYLMSEIENVVGPNRYFIATNVISGWHSAVGTGWESGGETIIYDTRQVKFAPKRNPSCWPSYDTDCCYEFDDNIEDWYQTSVPDYSSCETEVDNPPIYPEARVSSAIFEFPIGSNKYFTLYNTHLGSRRGGPCNLPDTFDYISNWNDVFFSFMPTGSIKYEKYNYKTYTPIYAGDMNLHIITPDCEELCRPDCNPVKYDIFEWFEAPQEYVESDEGGVFYHIGSIDVVWLGRSRC